MGFYSDSMGFQRDLPSGDVKIAIEAMAHRNSGFTQL